MLIREQTLGAIVDGTVRVAFRRWKRLTVRAGGTLLTSHGVLAIQEVEAISVDAVSEADALAAGHRSRAALLDALGDGPGTVYRVSLSYAGPDPRVALRSTVPGPEEISAIVDSLRAIESRSADAWCEPVLRAIAEHPETRAVELAAALVVDKAKLKRRVRRLKGMGITISCEVGYRLSPRGEAVLRGLDLSG